MIRALHWLPVEYCTVFKKLLLTFKTIHNWLRLTETLRLRFFGIFRRPLKSTRPGPCRQVCCLRFTFVRLDHAPEESDLPHGFLRSKARFYAVY